MKKEERSMLKSKRIVGTVLVLRDKRLGIAAGIVALLIAFSRLYLNVHYATDVAAGILLGIFCGWLVTFVFRRLKYL